MPGAKEAADTGATESGRAMEVLAKARRAWPKHPQCMEAIVGTDDGALATVKKTVFRHLT